MRSPTMIRGSIGIAEEELTMYAVVSSYSFESEPVVALFKTCPPMSVTDTTQTASYPNG